MLHTPTRHSALIPQHLDTVIRVSGFVKRYKKHEAVRGVDLEVRKGEIYGLIGPDGAGKSSLMKAMAGVLSYEAGTVEVFGVTVDSEPAATTYSVNMRLPNFIWRVNGLVAWMKTAPSPRPGTSLGSRAFCLTKS